jgi:DNA-binding NarL/FixJ family response regulator
MVPTDRELEVLGLVGDGLTTPAIAAELGIKTTTVESHVRSASRKLGARTRWQAATFGGRDGETVTGRVA